MRGPDRTCNGCLYFQVMDSETGRCSNKQAEVYQRSVIRYGVAPRLRRSTKGCDAWEDAHNLRSKVLALDAQKKPSP